MRSGYVLEKLRVEFTDFTRALQKIFPGIGRVTTNGERLLYTSARGAIAVREYRRRRITPEEYQRRPFRGSTIPVRVVAVTPFPAEFGLVRECITVLLSRAVLVHSFPSTWQRNIHGKLWQSGLRYPTDTWLEISVVVACLEIVSNLGVRI